MSFFKLNKNKKTADLKLSDYNNIWTKFCFLDETGTLSNRQEQYFTVGILKMSQPYYLQNRLLFERSKEKFYDEIKFNKISKNNITFAKIAIDALFETKSVNFYSYSISTKSDYFLKNKLGARSFENGFKNHNFNIFVDKTDNIFISRDEANEKGLSS